MRLVFAGSPEAAVPSLRRSPSSGHEVVGRHHPGGLAAGPQAGARRRPRSPPRQPSSGLPVIKANRLGWAGRRRPSRHSNRTSASSSPTAVWSANRCCRCRALGWINLHFSLLPRWRGAAPVQRAIIAGDDLTGATVFQLVEELDAGDVYGQLTQPIGDAPDRRVSCSARLADGGAELLVRRDRRPRRRLGHAAAAERRRHARPQADPGRRPRSTGPRRRTAKSTSRIRGVTPEPGAFTEHRRRHGSRSSTRRPARGCRALPPGRTRAWWTAGVLDRHRRPTRSSCCSVHPAGKKAMRAGDWWRGRVGQSSVAQ